MTPQNRRAKVTIRIIRAMILMSQSRWFTLADLAREGKVSIKTVRRDLVAISEIGVPAMEDRLECHAVYRIEPHWIKRFQGGSR